VNKTVLRKYHSGNLFSYHYADKSHKFKFKTAQNSKNLRLNRHTRFEFQTRNYINFYILS